MMRSCLILGSGRSGTSMVAGVLSQAGYYMGQDLIGPRPQNPKGFFEAREINRINEDILARMMNPFVRAVPAKIWRGKIRFGQRWMVCFPVGATVTATDGIRRRIVSQTEYEPYCFKDPRFSYTLPVWRPFVGDALFICVFREPERTANSIVKACSEAKYLRNLRSSFDYSRAIEAWCAIYSHVLQTHRHTGDWLFVHYDQMLDGSACELLEQELGAPVDRSFVDSSLKRSPSSGHPGERARRIYEQLCTLAGHPAGQT